MIMKRIFAIAAAAVALAASLSSCVQDKVYGLPTITGINNTVAVLASDEVVVTATVTSLTGISSVNLLWAADGGAWTPRGDDGDRRRMVRSDPRPACRH